MVEAKAEVTREQFAELEDLIFELEDATRWNLYENFDDKGYWIQGIFDDEAHARSSWAELEGLAPFALSVAYAPVEDKDWKESYKEHFKPWSIGMIHWVPDWLRESYELPDGHEAVWLDPGLAFGTGNHGTTRLCVEQMIAYKEAVGNESSASVIDAGCGSGILAISAEKIGYKAIHAFDNDPEAVRIALENAEMNATTLSTFEEGDLVTGLEGRQADCLMANILAHILMRFADNLVASVAPDGWLILSGILREEAEQVRAHFEPLADWTDIQITYLDEWSCVRLIRA